MPRIWRMLMVVVVFVCVSPQPARADLTAFVGATIDPANRFTRGLAIGVGVLIVGVEVEYSSAGEDQAALAPSLRTGMGNVLLQTPFPIAGIQFYATAGGGLYRETLLEEQQTNVGVNVGGGIKWTLAGPLRVRFDYRVFRLRGALHERPQRVYAGLNLAF
jgi:opacity protein-like surface antigen